MRKGQLALFVVLAIIIVSVIVLGLFLRKSMLQGVSLVDTFKPAKLQNEAADVSRFVDQCLEYSLQDALLKVSSRGGYYNMPLSVAYESYNVPIYYNNGQEKVPTIESIENEIADYIDESIADCAGNFGKVQLEVTKAKRPEAVVSIGSKSVSVELTWPLILTKEGDSTRVSDFSAETVVAFKGIFDKAIELYNDQKAKNVISLADLARLAKSKDYLLHFDFKEGAVVYVLTFNDVTVKKQPVVYTFAIKPKAEKDEKFLYQGVDLTSLFSPLSGTEEAPEEE